MATKSEDLCLALVKMVRVIKYPVYGPLALAGIGRLPATLMSRSIIIPMHRSTIQQELFNPRGRILFRGNCKMGGASKFRSQPENASHKSKGATRINGAHL